MIANDGDSSHEEEHTTAADEGKECDGNERAETHAGQAKENKWLPRRRVLVEKDGIQDTSQNQGPGTDCIRPPVLSRDTHGQAAEK